MPRTLQTNRRILKLVAIARFGYDYHSGGGSRLYRLACRADHILKTRYNVTDPWLVKLGDYGKRWYTWLENNYREDRVPGYRRKPID